ncbi:MAG: peptide deformylase [Succiniclasticum sp.]|nr:peptide deformylase [Succiniclasticum sp.]MDY6087343.1 peptide deformylase [Succiniclasticum sp.]
MSVLRIHTAGDPVLKEVAKPVKRIDKKIKRALKDMADTLYRSKNGIGLAAPQVGISQRMVVIDLQDGQGLLELINPVITRKEGSQIVSEGCLSVPDFEGEVERAEYVECEYTDPQGKKQFIVADGLLAICLQHETDHLDGVLFIDKAVTVSLKAPEA